MPGYSEWKMGADVDAELERQRLAAEEPAQSAEAGSSSDASAGVHELGAGVLRVADEVAQMDSVDFSADTLEMPTATTEVDGGLYGWSEDQQPQRPDGWEE